MEAINKREKTIAFVKFSSLFLSVIVLVVLAIFTDFRFPDQEIKTLREMNQKLTQQAALQEEIISIADSTRANFVRIGRSDQLFRILEGKISTDINNLQKFANDTNLQGRIVKNIHASYMDWLADKITLHKNADLPNELQRMKDKLQEAEDDLRDCKMESRN